jgi:hypothetical protein
LLKKSYKGQAFGLSSFCTLSKYFYGARYKSDGANTQEVPYKFSNVDLTPARNTVEVYGFINSDLDNATVLLSGSVRSNKSNINQEVRH